MTLPSIKNLQSGIKASAKPEKKQRLPKHVCFPLSFRPVPNQPGHAHIVQLAVLWTMVRCQEKIHAELTRAESGGNIKSRLPLLLPAYTAALSIPVHPETGRQWSRGSHAPAHPARCGRTKSKGWDVPAKALPLSRSFPRPP